MKRFLASPVAAAALLLGSCGSVETLPEPVAAAGLSVHAADVYSPGPRLKRYTIEKPGSPGAAAGELVREFSAIDGSNAWTITTREGERATLEVRLERGADGTVAIKRLNDLADHRETVFDPPLTLLPAVCPSGAAHMFEAKATIGAESGPARSTVTAYSAADGARSVRTVIVIKLGPTTVTRTTDVTLDAGRGVVREREQRTIVLGGLTIRADDRILVLDRVEEGRPATRP